MTDAATVGGVAVDRLQEYVERAERLHEARKAIGEDLAELFKAAKSAGFDGRALKTVLARRRRGAAETSNFDELVALYERALAAADQAVPA